MSASSDNIKKEWLTFEADDYKVEARSDFKNFKGYALAWDDIAQLKKQVDMVFKNTKSRQVVRILTGKHDVPTAIFLKRYKFKKWFAPYLRMARSSRAREECLLGKELLEKGIRTPEPLWIAEACGALKKFSLIAAEAIPEGRNCIQIWRHEPDQDIRAQLMKSLGAYLRSLHDRKFFHDDCKAEHFVISKPDPIQAASFWVIDLLGCGFIEKVTPEQRALNLMQTLRSFNPREESLGFTAAYRNLLLEGYEQDSEKRKSLEHDVKKIATKKAPRIFD